MELIERARNLYAGIRNRNNNVSTSGSESTSITIISSERCFDVVLSIPDEDEERSVQNKAKSYAEMYIHLLGTLNIFPYQAWEKNKTKSNYLRYTRKVTVSIYNTYFYNLN